MSASTLICTSSAGSRPEISGETTAHFKQTYSAAGPTIAPIISIEHLTANCPHLSNIDIRFPEQHRMFPNSQLEPLRRAICRVLDQHEPDDSHDEDHFMRVTVPSCFPSNWYLGPTSTGKASTGQAPKAFSSSFSPPTPQPSTHAYSHAHIRPGPRYVSSDRDSEKRMKKRYIVERYMEDCRLHCLLESTLPVFRAPACA